MENILTRELIEELISFPDNRRVKVGGWVHQHGENDILLHDFTGDIRIILNERGTQYGYRDVIEVVGVLRHDENRGLYVDAEEVKLINKCLHEITLTNDYHDFLQNSYLYYQELQRIALIKLRNHLEKAVRKFLNRKNFIELSNPLLWTSVQEYGAQEWKVISALDTKQGYTLPQSPEIQMLLNTIGGIERNFQFNRCFRLDERNGMERYDSVIEFTQLDVTATFFSLEEGRILTQNLLTDIIAQVAPDAKVSFKEIDYSRSMYFYGTDKPDLRYEYFYRPSFPFESPESMKNVAAESIIIPASCDEKITAVIKKNLFQSFSADKFLLVLADEAGGYHIEGNFPAALDWNRELSRYQVKPPYTLILIDKEEGGKGLDFINVVCKSLYPKIFGPVPEYQCVWVTGLPFLNKYENSELGNSIFTKHQQDVLDNLDRPERLDNCTVPNSFDLVLNGIEIASGGLREHHAENFKKLMEFYRIPGYEKTYNYFIRALESGAPPVFVLGIGWERLLWLLFNLKYIQEIMILPKDYNGCCLLTGLPLEIGF